MANTNTSIRELLTAHPDAPVQAWAYPQEYLGFTGYCGVNLPNKVFNHLQKQAHIITAKEVLEGLGDEKRDLLIDFYSPSEFHAPVQGSAKADMEYFEGVIYVRTDWRNG